ncbi:hypothetical protein EC604_23240 [Paenibacillus amylolyticus]|uniref:Uncharacterized protein n=1 Tax=Paenibacillus amylolyticus TaxID=1451 RepID=A0A5M9WYM3_PAEAM|nr:hypothetical protein [Paenibacillus amylolyticus]KAA8786746.1 hypothetical protein EC604_23240 [Paenibacillus amylolyticus]
MDLNIKTHYLRRAQSAFLKGLDINPGHLSLLYNTIEESGYKWNLFKDLRDQYRRELIISVPFTPLESTALPTKDGETKQFKKLIQLMLNKYKEKYFILRPLLVNLKVTINNGFSWESGWL